MKDIETFFTVLLLSLVLTWDVHAQIYESADDQGSPVFSDEPSPDAKEVELPAGNIADAPLSVTRPAEAAPAKLEVIGSTSKPVSVVSREILADDQLVCGAQLSSFVPGESESERLYERPEPTELDSAQRKLLEQLFSSMSQSWRGEKVFYKCMDAAQESEMKVFHREAIGKGSWNVWNSELTFNTKATSGAKTTGTLVEFYGVGDGLYFILKSFGSGSGHVAGIPPNLKKAGNMVQIVSLGTDRLGFLIKKRSAEGILKPQLIYIETNRDKLTMKRASFVNARLTDWVTTELSR